ncbi:MAG: DMT family transporter [Actinobacteria bacterium]|nr:MAG: DMT family transporter [Actinomycetota bacterium]
MLAPERHPAVSAGVIKIAIAALIWGSMGVLIRLTGMSAVAVVFWRSVFATAAMLAIVIVTGHARQILLRQHRLLVPLTGVLLLVCMVFFAKAVQLTTVANAILVVYTAPVLIALLAPIFLHERLERRTLVALALALIGIGSIVAPQGLAVTGGHLAGIGSAFVTAAGYAVLVLVGKRVIADVSARIMALYQSAVAMVLLLPLMVARPLPPSGSVWVLLVLLGVVHTAIAGVLYLSGLRDVTAQNAGILAYLEPLSGAIYGMVFLAEPLSIWVVSGGLLIAAGGWLVVRAGRAEPALPPR